MRTKAGPGLLPIAPVGVRFCSTTSLLPLPVPPSMSLSNFNVHLDRPETLETLAKALNVAPDYLKAVIEEPDPESLYRVHEIPKRRRAADGTPLVRVVWEAQSPPLAFCHKAVARRLATYLEHNVAGFPHPASNGFVRGRSTKRNAAPHAGAKHLVSLDIESFFESVSRATVETALRHAGLKREPARVLATLLTPQGFLQPGLAASPTVANLVLAPLDEDMARLAAERQLSYSRYADDLTFSGAANLPSISDLEPIAARHRLRFNLAKFKVSTRGQRHTVTGLTVTDEGGPHVPRKRKRHLLRELHLIEKSGMGDHVARKAGNETFQAAVNRIDGWVNYVASVETTLGPKLRARWGAICSKDGLNRSFSGRNFEKLRDAIWVIDEMVCEIEGGRCLALMCIDVLDELKVTTAVQHFRTSLLQDASMDPSKHRYLAEKGLHWEHLNMTQRVAFVEVLSGLPFRATCAFAPLDDDYEATYIALLKKILVQEMLSADDAEVTLFVEQTDHVSQTLVLSAIREAWKLLGELVRRHPSSVPTAEILSKGANPLLPVADAMLGVLKGFVDFRPPEPDEKFRAYQALKMHFRLIFDDVRGRVFSSRKPMPVFDS